MITDETLELVCKELEGMEEREFTSEVCHLFMVLMLSGGISECVYRVPQNNAVLNYDSGSILQPEADEAVH